jgi:hypothetical protein
MPANSVESRLGIVERDMAALRQQVQALDEDVRGAAHLASQQAVLTEQVTTLRELVKTLGHNFDTLKTDLREREKQQVAERKADRRWLVGTVLTSTMLIITAIGILVSVLS